MKFGTNVLQLNTHRLTELGFRFDIIISRWQQWLFCVSRCCLASNREASAG